MHILHVGFNIDPDQKKIKEVFDGAESWLNYAPNCWLLWTDKSASDWNARLERAIEANKRHFFICRLDTSDRQGWLPKDAWNWLNGRAQR